jgi:predicted nucleic acid-binding protein
VQVHTIDRGLVSFVSYTEILYTTLREQGEAVAQEHLSLLRELPLTRVESDPALALATGRLKATYPLSLADCWVAALAECFETVLVHKDPEFPVLGHRIESVVLPYKPAGA